MSDVTAGLVETAARAAYESQNVIPGSAYTFPRSAARTTAVAVLAAVLPKIAEVVEAERVCAECSDFYSGRSTLKHDLELGCAPGCPCQHKHAAWVGYSDGAVHRIADLLRSLAEGLGA